MGETLSQVVEDFEKFRDPHADPELEAVKAALFIEDVFDIQLSDHDIGVNLLAPGAVFKLISRLRRAS